MKKISDRLNNWKEKRHNSLNFRRRRRHIQMVKVRFLGSTVLIFAVVILLAFFLAFGFFRRTENLGPSMNPTIRDGDQVLLNHVIYHIKSPKRGDIVAFLPKNNQSAQISVKRVIGVPGDTIQIKNGAVYINGKIYSSDVTNETINDSGLADSKIKLKKNQYFVLGDNRNNSEDSRYETVGNVTASEIKGKVWFNITPSNFGLME